MAIGGPLPGTPVAPGTPGGASMVNGSTEGSTTEARCFTVSVKIRRIDSLEEACPAICLTSIFRAWGGGGEFSVAACHTKCGN